MIGAIIGDIAGSRFEWDNIKVREFEFFTDKCTVTDDSVMTIAIAHAFLESDGSYRSLRSNAVSYMQKYGRKYPYAGYGGNFIRWIISSDPKPYGSYGNGSAMRVSPAGWAADCFQKARTYAEAVTDVTHNHEEGIRGAVSVAEAIFLGKNGYSKDEIRKYITENHYSIDFTLNEIRDRYSFDVSCQGSVPQAFQAFFESSDFESAVRNAISIGGDSDTIAAIAGSIAESYYGVPEELRKKAMEYLDDDMKIIINRFEERYGRK